MGQSSIVYKNLQYNKVVHTTIHINNWYGLNDMKMWIDENNYTWTTNVLTYPQHLDIINLEKEDKEKLVSILNSFDIPNKSYIHSHIK